MSAANEITGTQLTNALRALNVNFIMVDKAPAKPYISSPHA
jgi:hypothetical protein